MSKKIIYFVCNEVNYNLANRRSAIDSILHSILLALSGRYDIYVNGEHLLKLKSESRELSNQGKSISNVLKRFVPKRIKESLKIARLLKESDSVINTFSKAPYPDIIIELYKLGSHAGMELKNQFKVPLLTYYDSPVVEQYEDIQGISAPFRGKLFERQVESLTSSDAIIAYSNPVKEKLKKWGVKCPITIFQTLDYSRLSFHVPSENDIINIGFVGSFMPWHRVDLLFESFEKLCDQGHKKIMLHLVGKGECYPQIEQKYLQSRYKDRIKLYGFIDGPELEDVKAGMQIGVMPGSNWYGMPTKVYEYGAAGIASIAPDTPTISDIFTNKENILLFKWDDENDFLVKLKHLISDSGFRESIAHNMQNLIKNDYTQTRAEEFYRKLIDDLVTSQSQV